MGTTSAVSDLVSAANAEAGGDDNADTWQAIPLCCWCKAPLAQAQILGGTHWVCPAPPCYTRQLKFGITVTRDGKQTLVYLPLPRQTEAHEAVASQLHRRILYGGAAGGGKSKFLRWLAYSLCLSRKNFRVLLLRRTWPELEETHIRESIFDQELFGEGGGGVMKVTPSNRVVDFPLTGSYLKFGHCQDDKDMATFLSREYDLILFDELVTFEEIQYLLISSRARTSRDDGWMPMVVAGTNPGGPGAGWVKEIFIDRSRDKKKYPNYKPADHHYIRALLDDNPYINASYIDFLMDLPPDMREAYRFGRWDIFPGQYFKEFRAQRGGHPWHAGTIFVPPSIPRICGMDWGYLKPGVILWAVVLPDSGRLYIEREWVFTETPPSMVAKAAALMTRLWGFSVVSRVGDPAMAIRQAESGEDIFETMAKNGWPVTPSKNERVNGWTRVREWLRSWPDGRPGLVINPEGCPYLIRTLPQLMSDAHKPEDVDTDGEDHAADALRYLVMARPHPLQSGSRSAYPAGSVGSMLMDLVLANENKGVLGVHNVAR